MDSIHEQIRPDEIGNTAALMANGLPVILDEVKDAVLGSRLISMGVFPGTMLRLVRHTVGSSTFLIKAGDHYFAMRKKEVNALVVHPMEAA